LLLCYFGTTLTAHKPLPELNFAFGSLHFERLPFLECRSAHLYRYINYLLLSLPPRRKEPTLPKFGMQIFDHDKFTPMFDRLARVLHGPGKCFTKNNRICLLSSYKFVARGFANISGVTHARSDLYNVRMFVGRKGSVSLE
jgi:hypothetical protein